MAAEAIGVNRIQLLLEFLHCPPETPSAKEEEFTRLGSWLATCQRAVFEILYYYKEQAVPVLNYYAYGEYDWTQSNAIEILCRFGVEGIRRDEIAEALVADLPNWRLETIEYSITYLSRLACHSLLMAETVDKLISECESDDKMDAFNLLESVTYNAPEIAKKYKHLLYEIMIDLGRTQTEAVDNQRNEKFVSRFGYVAPARDYDAISAALALHHLFPQDAQVLDYLNTWAKHHPVQWVSDEIYRRVEFRPFLR